MARVSDRLCRKIEKELGLIVYPGTIKRTYAGRGALQSGIFSWTVQVRISGKGGLYTAGSCDRMRDCVRKNQKLWMLPPENGEIEIGCDTILQNQDRGGLS